MSIRIIFEELHLKSGKAAKTIQYYIDWGAMARDWEINDILTIETGFEAVHVFWRA